jgi:Fic family protein
LFFLAGVAEVRDEAAATARRVLGIRETYRQKVNEKFGRAAADGHRVMDRLFDRPIVTVATVREWLDVTPAGANNIVARLERIGLFREITGYARNRRFRFDPYLRLFEDGPEDGSGKNNAPG